MRDQLAPDRLGAMWLHAKVTRDDEGADLILDLGAADREAMLGALAIAVQVMRDSPVWYHHAHAIQRLLVAYSRVDDALEEGLQ